MKKWSLVHASFLPPFCGWPSHVNSMESHKLFTNWHTTFQLETSSQSSVLKLKIIYYFNLHQNVQLIFASRLRDSSAVSRGPDSRKAPTVDTSVVAFDLDTEVEARKLTVSVALDSIAWGKARVRLERDTWPDLDVMALPRSWRCSAGPRSGSPPPRAPLVSIGIRFRGNICDSTCRWCRRWSQIRSLRLSRIWICRTWRHCRTPFCYACSVRPFSS